MESTPLTGSSVQAQAIKISVEIEVDGKPALRASVQAEGDAQSVQQATAQLSAAVASLVLQLIEPQPAPETAPPAVALLKADMASAPTQTQASIQTPQPALLKWLMRYRQRFAIGFGGALVLAAMLVAVVFPPLVPRAQRIEVFMMSLAFGLIGAGALFAGALPGKHDAPAPQPAQVPIAPFAPRNNASAKALLQKQKPLNAIWGLGFGTLFLVAGIVAPFVLGEANADDRFLMMIGFAPVAVTGVLMIAIFWRAFTVRTVTSKTTTSTPGQAMFKLGVPLLIGTSLVILVAVLVLVLVATVLPILNR